MNTDAEVDRGGGPTDYTDYTKNMEIGPERTIHGQDARATFRNGAGNF